jgi:hypothetical protein
VRVYSLALPRHRRKRYCSGCARKQNMGTGNLHAGVEGCSPWNFRLTLARGLSFYRSTVYSCYSVTEVPFILWGWGWGWGGRGVEFLKQAFCSLPGSKAASLCAKKKKRRRRRNLSQQPLGSCST